MTNKEKLILGFWFTIVILFLVLTHHDIPQTEVYYESHIVKQGETLSEIVLMYDGNLKKSQGINPSVIMPGDKVMVVIER